jgi:hypothetical protein
VLGYTVVPADESDKYFVQKASHSISEDTRKAFLDGDIIQQEAGE